LDRNQPILSVFVTVSSRDLTQADILSNRTKWG